MIKNRFDFMMSSNRKIAGNCEVKTKVGIGNDHRMVRARVKIHKKLLKLKEKPKREPTQFTR